MEISYGLTSAVAFLMIPLCFYFERKRNPLVVALAIFVFIGNLGWLMTSLAGTLDEALMANRIAYLSSVFLPEVLLTFTAQQCGMSLNKWGKRILVGLGVVVYVIAASPGFSTLYYSSVSFRIQGGTSILVREYGPLHPVYGVFLGGCICALLLVIAVAFRTKQAGVRPAVFMLTVLMGNSAIWMIEKFLPREFEFLSVSILISEILILLFVGIPQQGNGGTAEVHEEETVPTQSLPQTEPLPTAQIAGMEPEPKKTRTESPELTQERIEQIVLFCEKEYTMTKRETDVLRCLLSSKKRKDIADELFLSESTIKKYTTQIYRKCEVSSRMELLLRLNHLCHS